MDQTHFNHTGSGDNVAGDKHVHISPDPEKPRSKYLNAFAHYDLSNLIGRESQLKAIETHLEKHNLLLLHGIGGIGKTTLAKAYISRAKDKYDHIAYVEIVGSIADSMLTQLGTSSDVRVEINPQLDLEQKFKVLIDALRRRELLPNLLLVLNNVNDVDDLRQRKNQLVSLNAKVLITGRARPQIFVQERNIQEIQALTQNEALDLFKYHYTLSLTDPEILLLKGVLSEAFYHPKLIEIISKVAQANTFLSLEALGQIVVKRHFSDDDANYPIEIDDQTKPIYRILLDLFDTDQLSEETKQLLRYFAILPTIDINVQDLATFLPGELSTKLIELNTLISGQLTFVSTMLQKQLVIERQALLSQISQLVGSSWLENLENRFFSMHGLVRWVVRERLLPTSANCEPLIKGMANALMFEPTENPLDKQHLLIYAVEWLTFFKDSKNQELGRAYAWIGGIYFAQNNYQQAIIYLREALVIRKDVLAATDPSLATYYNSLATCYESIGDHQHALAYIQQAQAINEAQLSPTDPAHSASLSNLAIYHLNLGDYQQALDYQKKAVAIDEASLPPTHPDLSSDYNNLARIYDELGDYQQALIYQKKSVAITETILSSTHPDLAASYNNLAVTYASLGDYQQALAYKKKATNIFEKALTPTHPELATAYNSIATTYRAIGEYRQALAYQNKAIAIAEAMQPLTHPNLATFYSGLSASHASLGDYQQALDYQKKAVAIDEALLPLTHPSLVTTYNNLGAAFSDLGDYEQALVYHKKAVDIAEAVLSPTHPTLASTYSNLGGIYGELYNHQEAIKYFKKSLAIREAVLPPMHSDLAISYNNLGAIYSDEGDYKQAVMYMQKAMNIFEAALPPTHPDLSTFYFNLANCYGFLKDFVEARKYMQKLVTLYEQILPSTHPKLITSRYHLSYIDQELKK